MCRRTTGYNSVHPRVGRAPQRPKTTGGFTIIELLVVVSIIAVLMGILLPSLKTARGSAKDTLCKTNLRSIFLAQTLFLETNKKFQPLSNAPGDGTWQYNYLIFDGGSREYNFGPLTSNKSLLHEVKLVYCPFQKDRFHTEDSDDNPWPPNEGFDTRAGYARRHLLTGRPLSEFRKTIAIFSDLNHLPKVIKSGHKKGLNASFIDGHVSWVSNPGIFTDNELGAPFSVLENPIMDEIWRAMDDSL